MIITEFLAKVQNAGIKLWVEEEKLCYRAPKGVITPLLRTELQQHKAAILELLTQTKSTAISSLPQIVPEPEKQHLSFPLTDIQQAYLIGRSSAFELGNVAAHAYFEIEGKNIDIGRFNTALNLVIERHGVLRTMILPNGQQQTLEKIPPYEIAVLDLSSQTPEQVNSQLQMLRDRLSHQILPTNQCPLFEICASRLNNQKMRLHFSLDLLIADFWSCQIFLKELLTLYQNPQAILPQLEISFRDYVQAVITFQASPLYQRCLDYWHKSLPTLPPAPTLPLAKHPSLIKHPQFTRRSHKLDSKTWLHLKNRAIQLGLTPSGLLCAAFAEVLAHWSENREFSLNVTLFNRLPCHPQVQHIMGDFTTTILLKIDNCANTFSQRATRLQTQLWEDLEYSQVSGIQILRELAKRCGNVLGAIMPIVFTSNLIADSTQDHDIFNQLFSEVYGISQTPQVWLDHQVFESNGILSFNWDTVEEIFPPGLLDDMFAAYCQILELLAWQEQVWHEPRANLVSLPPPLVKSTTAATCTSELLHTQFIKRSQQHPQQTAIITDHQTLTYAALYRHSNQLAHWLRQRDVRSNTLVAVIMEKGWEQVAAVLGILISGAAYLPLDPALPQERLWHLLAQGNIQLVLTQSWLTLALPDYIERLCVDDDKVVNQESDQPLDPIQTPQDLAYVIYTSGSTGLPKGVMIHHQAAINTIFDINQRFKISSSDRLLALSSLSFDLSVYDIFGTLAAGGTIVIPPASATPDPAQWVQLIAQHQVTVWNSVPALMQMLVDYSTSRHDVMLNSLRLMLLSGDWIPLTLPHAIRNLTDEPQIISLGGATEASIWSILYPITTVDLTGNSIPYGQPMLNQQVYVLNAALTTCPVWVPGSLYIGGVGLAQGYWQDEARTRASFITHPQTGERLYRTGDRGRYLPDGNIELIGREDFQVKIQGYRIELGEIEVALEQHPGVHRAVITAMGEQHDHKSLVAYVITRSGATPTTDELRGFLREKLPKYMVPSVFIYLDTLPLTTNGKIDRKALPVPDSTRPQLEQTFVAARTPLEEILAKIWIQVLGVAQVGIEDNFWELGGNSLQITELMASVRDTLQVELPLASFFETPTISGLTQAINIVLSAGSSTVVTATTTADLNAEAVLDSAICPDILPVRQAIAPNQILLTGATGFLGAYLLFELLQQTSANIYCLVRAANIAAGKAKIHSKLKSYGLWYPDLASRIIPVLGDLSQPGLGISPEQFCLLATSIDAIYHNGALVNFVYPYSALKATNVSATQEVLKLASQVKVKPVHFISTTGVFPAASTSSQVIYEADSIDHNAILTGGYVQSKWVAEKLVTLASDRGIPVCIYRPGFITGNSRTGVCSLSDFLSTTIKGCIQLGMAPDLDVKVDMTPVDFVSRGIVHLSRQETSLGQKFHLVNPQPLTWNQITTWIQSCGYELQQVAYEQWILELIKVPKLSLTSAFRALIPFFISSQERITHSGLLELDCQNTLNGLANTDIVCPPVNNELLWTQFSYFMQEGFLEKPGVMSAN
ncbi:MAG: amino acid adenylation domain-containing protein [Nodularia sp. CChRGM 3473]